jgi:hypothetical protein
MRYLVRLANPGRFTAADRKQLTKQAYSAVLKFEADIGNLRVSSFAVEFDLLTNSDDRLQDSLSALETQIGPLLTLRKLDVVGPPVQYAEAISLGLSLFNEERYWESHEALESAWKNSSGNEKEVLQGLILVAAALVHWQKNEKDITLSVMKRAREKLAPHKAESFVVDTAALTSKLDKILREGNPKFFRLQSNLEKL